jgi:HSP20 family protein
VRGRVASGAVPERDLFANFDRMRREMDALFGDVVERSFHPRGRSGFSPRVDVSYAADPPRAIVSVELAGIVAEEIELEVRGRELVISGQRGPIDETEGRVYQQVEIEHGPFRRTVQLGADVVADEARATYREGILRVELPLEQPELRTRSVPVEVPRP